MFETPSELAEKLGTAVRSRRRALGWTQADAASRAGVSYITWRRLEKLGKASIEDLMRAAVALRCEEGLADLFPLPAASSMDALLDQQRGQRGNPRSRASRRS